MAFVIEFKPWLSHPGSKLTHFILEGIDNRCLRSLDICSGLLGRQLLMFQAKQICHSSRGNAHRHSSKCTRRRTCEFEAHSGI